MIVLGVPVYRRYDLLARLVDSLRSGTVQPDKVIVVDNGCASGPLPAATEVISPGRNVGVAGAWNLMIDRARILRAEKIIIANDDVQLGSRAIEQLLGHKADWVNSCYDYSLFVLSTSLVDRIGWFDEAFWPAYYEMMCFFYRMKLGRVSMKTIAVEMRHELNGTIKSLSPVQRAAFMRRCEELCQYYVKKWGGVPRAEKFNRPFNGRTPRGWHERCVTLQGARFPEPWSAKNYSFAEPLGAAPNPSSRLAATPITRRVHRRGTVQARR